MRKRRSSAVSIGALSSPPEPPPSPPPAAASSVSSSSSDSSDEMASFSRARAAAAPPPGLPVPRPPPRARPPLPMLAAEAAAAGRGRLPPVAALRMPRCVCVRVCGVMTNKIHERTFHAACAQNTPNTSQAGAPTPSATSRLIADALSAFSVCIFLRWGHSKVLLASPHVAAWLT